MKIDIPPEVLRQAADPSIYSPVPREKAWALMMRLAADLIEAGELRPTATELARWASVQPSALTADVLSAMAVAALRGEKPWKELS